MKVILTITKIVLLTIDLIIGIVFDTQLQRAGIIILLFTCSFFSVEILNKQFNKRKEQIWQQQEYGK